MIDLCKIFGVEEWEGFKIKGKGFDNRNYRIKCNKLFCDDGSVELRSCLGVNDLTDIKEIIKLPKRKEFTDDELCILRNFNKKYKWLCKDKCGDLTLFVDKPIKDDDIWDTNNMCILDVQISFPHLFQCIQWEDEEPVFIDDYVERK